MTTRSRSASAGRGRRPGQERASAPIEQPVSTTSGQPAAVKKPVKLTLAKLESLLFKACDILRGKMDASEYKEYIFGMLFLRAIEADRSERSLGPR